MFNFTDEIKSETWADIIVCRQSKSWVEIPRKKFLKEKLSKRSEVFILQFNSKATFHEENFRVQDIRKLSHFTV